MAGGDVGAQGGAGEDASIFGSSDSARVVGAGREVHGFHGGVSSLQWMVFFARGDVGALNFPGRISLICGFFYVFWIWYCALGGSPSF